ncbi:MAG: leucine-rich repeat domain-containing protein, partial [Muribaculaceae bacterium]|nr:leucine-rich repeat domain-containing protein [Muribaculaceae bacterium]
MSHNTALTSLECNGNQLTALDVSNNTALTYLTCIDNQLTALDVSNNTALTYLECYNNQINGGNMEALVASLPTVDVIYHEDEEDEYGEFYVIDLDSETEQNVITTAQVTTARGKNWKVYGLINGGRREYDGSAEGLHINSINFPDDNFRNYLRSQNYGRDRVLTDEEIASITYIDVSNMDIADLAGIEHFTALTELYCNGNQLDTLDLSNNTALTDLSCSDNQLTALDVSQNTALEYLYCSNNQLTALDLSHNTALTYLYCPHNQLDTLDLSHNRALKYLYCYNNQLNTLDVSNNTALTELYCYNNQINGANMEALVTSLPTVDINTNNRNGKFYVINLDSETEQNVITPTQVTTARGKNWTVYGRTNYQWEEYDGAVPIDSINFPDANFRNYLLSKSYGNDGVLTDEEIAGIITIYVSHKNIADLTGIEHFAALKSLNCSSNQLTALDVSHNTALKELNCSYNQLTALDLSNNTALTDLFCYNNQLDTLDVSHNTALTQLYCFYNQLTSLDVSHNTILNDLDCSCNQLTALDVSNNTALTYLVCSD